MTIAVLCRLCGRHIMEIKAEHLTSNHCDAVCSACETRQIEVLNFVRKMADDSIRKIESIEGKFVEDITRLSSMGIAGVNSQSMQKLENRMSEEEKSDG